VAELGLCVLELIPNGGRPNNYLIATAKSYIKYSNSTKLSGKK
jgi:hypothetical protein